MMRYMIYELRNPITDLPFYIGWTDTAVKGKHRPIEHLLEEARFEGKITKGNRLKLNTIRKIREAGKTVEIREIFWSDDFDYSLSIEIHFIALYGRKDRGTGCLTNMTDGGEGTLGRKDSDETKRKKSKSKMGISPSAKTRSLLSAALKGKPSYIRTEETLAKLSKNNWNTKQIGKSYEELHGSSKSINIREKQSASRKKYLKEHPEAETSKKLAHKITWIKKMASAYTAIFALLDSGKRQCEIATELGVSYDTVRKAMLNRDEITQMVNQYAGH